MTAADLITELQRLDSYQTVRVQIRYADELGDDEFAEVLCAHREDAPRPFIALEVEAFTLGIRETIP